MAFSLGCDRNLEPFDPSEEPRQPDLARIFPETQGPGPGLGAARPSGQPSPAPAPAPMGRRGAAPVTVGNPGDSGDSPRGGATIRGRIEVAPELAADVASGSVLFLIARTGAGGPPLAVRRFASPSFPVEFEIGQQNVMIPSRRFEGAIQLTARLDSDGNAMTRLAGDLQGAIPGPVSPGEEDAVLTLDQKI